MWFKRRRLTEEEQEAFILIRAALLEIRSISYRKEILLAGGEAAVTDRDDYHAHMNRVADISIDLLSLVIPNKPEKEKEWRRNLTFRAWAAAPDQPPVRWARSVLASEGRR